ncbi:MAG: hypothetical protein ACKVVT_09875 [Dehalococcoidia bacterium]
MRAAFGALNPDEVVPSAVWRERWTPDASPMDGSPILVGEGRYRRKPLGAVEQQQLFQWVLKSNWLGQFGAVSVADRVAYWQAFLERFGAVTLRTPAPRRAWIGPDGEFIDATGREVSPEQVILSQGAPIDPSTGPGSPSWVEELASQPGLVERAHRLVESPSLLDLAEMEVEFSHLRDAILVLSLLGQQRPGRALEFMDKANQVWSYLARVARDEAGEDEDAAARIAARLLISMILQKHTTLMAVPWVVDPRRPAKVILRGARPVDSLWLSMAVTVGHIEPPTPIEGVFVCAYEPCGKVFLRPPDRQRPGHAFCSDACGRRFHAAKSTRARRAAKRQVRAREDLIIAEAPTAISPPHP